MDLGVTLGTYTGGREAGAVDIVEVTFTKLRLSRFFLPVDVFPGNGRGEGKFVRRDAEDRTCVVPFRVSTVISLVMEKIPFASGAGNGGYGER